MKNRTGIRWFAFLTLIMFMTSILNPILAFGYKMQETKLKSSIKIIVKFKDDSKATESLKNVESKMGGLKIKEGKKFHKNKLRAYEIADDKDIKQIFKLMNKDKNIEYAQLDYNLTIFDIPQDPLYGKQWGLSNGNPNRSTGQAIDINVEKAWDLTKGDNSIIVGVIDTGIDMNHNDLNDNIYVNSKEIPGDGVDNDNNSYIDDVNGWNFMDNNNFSGDTSTLSAHGTHVAGIIAAEQNEEGISGIAPNVKLMPLKFIGNNFGNTSDAIEAIEYADKMGVKIINCSWGCMEYNPALKEAILDSKMLFVCAAGNNGSNTAVYPAAFDLPNILSVAAIDRNGEMASFSNYGNGVDLAAPGVDILSTLPNNKYELMSGTSMATPFVAGVAALINSKEPTMNVQSIAQRIKSNVSLIDSLKGKVEFNGMLNAFASLENTAGCVDLSDDGVSIGEQDLDKMHNLADVCENDNSLESNGKILKPILPDNSYFTMIKNINHNDLIKLDDGIKNVSGENVGNNKFTVTWLTNENSTTEFYYGGFQELGKQVINSCNVKEHQVFFGIENSDDINWFKIVSRTETGKIYETTINDISTIIDKSTIVPKSVNSDPQLPATNNNTTDSAITLTTDAAITSTTEVAVSMGNTSLSLETSANNQVITDKPVAAMNQTGLVTNFNQEIGVLGVVYENEPNDDFSMAQQIGIDTVSGSCSRIISNGGMIAALPPIGIEPPPGPVYTYDDVDIYCVSLSAQSEYSFALKDITAGLNLDLSLYDANYNYILSSNNIKGIDETVNFIPTSTGYYYLEVSIGVARLTNTTGTWTDNYQLILGISEKLDQYETNNSQTTATPIIKSNTYNANISNLSDEDWYKITVSSTGKLYAQLKNIPMNCDYDIAIYNGSGANIGGSFNRSNLNEIGSVLLPGQGTYYLRVYSYSGFSNTEYYSLSYEFSRPDQYETNESASQAKIISFGSQIIATIDSSLDQDYYKFDLAVNTDLLINLINIPTNADYDVALYNSSFVLVSQSSNRQNANEIVNVKLTPGSYFIKVISYAGYSDLVQYNLILRNILLTPVEDGTADKNWSSQSGSFNLLVNAENGSYVYAKSSIGDSIISGQLPYITAVSGKATIPVDITKLNLGMNTISIYATDNIGNKSGYLLLNITRDGLQVSYTIKDCTLNKQFSLNLAGINVANISNKQYTLTYNKNELEVVDLCGLTVAYETTEAGVNALPTYKIKGTDIRIVTFTPGKIVFCIEKSVPAGKVWTGILNIVKFKCINSNISQSQVVMLR